MSQSSAGALSPKPLTSALLKPVSQFQVLAASVSTLDRSAAQFSPVARTCDAIRLSPRPHPGIRSRPRPAFLPGSSETEEVLPRLVRFDGQQAGQPLPRQPGPQCRDRQWHPRLYPRRPVQRHGMPKSIWLLRWNRFIRTQPFWSNICGRNTTFPSRTCKCLIESRGATRTRAFNLDFGFRRARFEIHNTVGLPCWVETTTRHDEPC